MSSKNEVIGVVPCWGRSCDERASVHESKRGGANRRGLLYLNCPSCKCLQPTSQASQDYIKQNLEPRPGFEHYKTEPAQQPSADPGATEKPTEKPTEPGTKPTPGKKGAILGAAGLLGLLAYALS